MSSEKPEKCPDIAHLISVCDQIIRIIEREDYCIKSPELLQ